MQTDVERNTAAHSRSLLSRNHQQERASASRSLSRVCLTAPFWREKNKVENVLGGILAEMYIPGHCALLAVDMYIYLHGSCAASSPSLVRHLSSPLAVSGGRIDIIWLRENFTENEPGLTVPAP